MKITGMGLRFLGKKRAQHSEAKETKLAMIVIFVTLIFLYVLAPAESESHESDFSETEVEFMSGQTRLAGVILLPKTQSKSPAVVIIHGSGDSDRNNLWAREFAEGLAYRGIAVLLPDKRGSGKSGGDWKKASFEELADDANAGVELLRQHPKVISGVVGVMGLSQGGKIAPLASTRSSQIAFVVSVSSSVVPLIEQVSDEVEKSAERAKFSRQQIERVNEIQRRAVHYATTGEGWEEYLTLLEKELKSDLAGRKVVEPFPRETDHWVWQWVRRVGNFDPLPHWQKLNTPALIAYGARDTQIRVGKNISRLTNATESKDLKYRVLIYGDSGHGLHDPLTRKVRGDFLDQLTGWINSHTSKTSLQP